MALFFSGKCEMASFFSWIVVSLVVTAVNHDFFKIFFSEMRNKRLIHCECLFWSRFQLLRNKHCINETNNPFGASTWAIFSGKRISFCLPLVEKWRGEQNLIGFLSSSKMSPFIRVTWNVYFIFRELRKVFFLFRETWPRAPLTTLVEIRTMPHNSPGLFSLQGCSWLQRLSEVSDTCMLRIDSRTFLGCLFI